MQLNQRRLCERLLSVERYLAIYLNVNKLKSSPPHPSNTPSYQRNKRLLLPIFPSLFLPHSPPLTPISTPPSIHFLTALTSLSLLPPSIPWGERCYLFTPPPPPLCPRPLDPREGRSSPSRQTSLGPKHLRIIPFCSSSFPARRTIFPVAPNSFVHL